MRTDPTRFDRVLEHPDCAAAPAQPVLPADTAVGVAAVAGPLMVSLFGALFLLVAISLLITIRPPFLFSLAMIVGGLVVVAGGVIAARRIGELRDAPVERLIAVIVKERTDVHGIDRADTTYYATLQTRDGVRTEYRVSHALVGRLVVDDIGVAYVKDRILDLGIVRVRARTLVEFIRVDVA